MLRYTRLHPDLVLHAARGGQEDLLGKSCESGREYLRAICGPRVVC